MERRGWVIAFEITLISWQAVIESDKIMSAVVRPPGGEFGPQVACDRDRQGLTQRHWPVA